MAFELPTTTTALAESWLNTVWGYSVFVTGRSVDRCITTLRNKIELDPHNPVYIHTVRGVGYRFD